MKTLSGMDLSKIGIGTYGIGGKGHRDMHLTEKQDDQTYINALSYMLSKGINFTEISLGYGHGNAMDLFAKTVNTSGINRDTIFITNSLYPRDFSNLEEATQDINAFYKMFNTDYSDSTLVTQSLIIKYSESNVFKLLQDLLKSERTRQVSLSNASPNWLRKFKSEFGDKFFAHEGHLSFEVRSSQDKGVFSTCDRLGVTNIIWRPFLRNLTFKHNWPLLKELSEKYSKTQSQIILNWINVMGYKPMVFSTNMEHIDENISSTEFDMSEDDFNAMVNFRPEEYKIPPIDWEGIDVDDDIVIQTKEFDSYKVVS